MKCGYCHGTGLVTEFASYGRVLTDCLECNGTGYIDMTNEEWFDTLSTTEEKAEAIYECVMANSWSFNKDGIKRWLKQPHT